MTAWFHLLLLQVLNPIPAWYNLNALNYHALMYLTLLSHFNTYEQPRPGQYPLCSLLLSPLFAAASPACLMASSSPRILAKWALISSALIGLLLSANSLKNGFSFSL